MGLFDTIKENTNLLRGESSQPESLTSRLKRWKGRSGKR